MDNRDYLESIYEKIRKTVAEYGPRSLDCAFILMPDYAFTHISNIPVILAPTISLTLGNVSFEIARFFEDA